jgi:tetratricopeptide (TPR) repeat protein
MVALRQLVAGVMIALCVAAGSTASATDPGAAQRTARLNELFAELQSTKDEDRGRSVTAGIWQLWMKSGRDDIDKLTQEAVAYMAAGALTTARGVLDSIVAQAPEYAEGWNKRATLLFMMHEHALSLKDIDKVLSLEPRHFGALAGQGLIHIAAERWKEALSSMRRAVAVNPFLAERTTIMPALERKVEGVPL